MLTMSRIYFILLVLAIACGKKEAGPASFASPVSPDHAVSTFRVQPGFKIELIAAEPLIADPVAMEIDENGNMYVVENHGYPLDKKRSSKVKLLRDTDGDGVMDRSTIFADTLMMPTGVMRWKKGILVTDAPDVLYMEDTDDDGSADIVKPVLTGFALSNPQHNVNTPILGLDNWIYIAHERTVGSEVYRKEFGDGGSDVFFPERPDGVRLPRNANGRNVRMRPDTYELEMLASTTQYGHTFDEWGNHFLANNSNHLMHSVVDAEYLRRNPALIVPRSTSSPPDHGNAAEVFPITKTPDRQLLTDVGVMTSACAITAYTGGSFPHEFNTNTTFVAEPVSNIVHADKLKASGSTFVASRMFERQEFLASTDMWCRPVNLYVGPDGALYVVDYYREIIEHPEWLADEVINSGRLYNGHDMGRIFRVSATGTPPVSWTRNLALNEATDAELVAKLPDPNLWWRRTAQRLLIDRKSAATVPELRELAENEQSALGRLHALWTLQGMDQLREHQITKALRDREPGVRVHAVKLAGLHLKKYPRLAERLISLQNDADAKVRFQLLCTLGSLDSQEAAAARNNLLFMDVTDEFVQVAALSAAASQTIPLLNEVLRRYNHTVPAYGSLVQSLTAMAASHETSRYVYTLVRDATAVLPEDSSYWQIDVLKGLAKGFATRPNSLPGAEQSLLMNAFFDHPAFAVRQAAFQLLKTGRQREGSHRQAAMRRARTLAADERKPERDRSLAIDFLSLHVQAEDVPFLEALILSGQPLAVKLAGIRTLNSLPGDGIADFLMEHWSSFTPAVQDAALNTFMEKESRVSMLVDALESGKVQPASLGWQRSIRLMTQRNIELRNRARAFFQKGEERRKIINDYGAALKLTGDMARGEQIYLTRCGVCHQVKGAKGIPFGPDLGTIQGWPAPGILENILDPNQSIAHGFDLWNVTLKDGQSLQGIITDETPSSMTLRNAEGQVHTLRRDDISSQKALNMSAMPVGLEKDITHQDMADLIAYLRNGNKN